MGLVIDTSAIVELERARKLEKLPAAVRRNAAFLPSIVWAELTAGVHLAGTVERALSRKSKLEKLRSAVAILPFTEKIAELWAELFAELHKKGHQIPSNDLAVISTALHHDHKILVSSADEKHFRRVARASVIAL